MELLERVWAPAKVSEIKLIFLKILDGVKFNYSYREKKRETPASIFFLILNNKYCIIDIRCLIEILNECSKLASSFYFKLPHQLSADRERQALESFVKESGTDVAIDAWDWRYYAEKVWNYSNDCQLRFMRHSNREY